jgi:GT2 family glycosyltransferase
MAALRDAEGGISDLRDGWILHGWVIPAAARAGMAVTVVCDDVAVATLPTYHSGVADVRNYLCPLPFAWHDGAPHRIAVRCAVTGAPVGETSAVIAQSRPYRSLDDMLLWAFHHRVVTAPFGETDQICLAFLDQQADRLAGRAAPAGEGPCVSVIMPVAPGEDAAELALRRQSLAAQTLTDWELLLIGSLPADAPALPDPSDPRVRALPQAGGLAAALDCGLRAARGRLVAYLPPGTRWDERYLAVMAQALTTRRVAFCGQYLQRPGQAQPFAVRLGGYNPALADSLVLIDPGCLVHARAAGLQAGGWNPALADALLPRAVQDFTGALARRDPPLFVPHPLAWSRIDPAVPLWPAQAPALRAALRARRDATSGAFCPLRVPTRGVVVPDEAASPGALTASPGALRGISIVIPSFEVPDSLALCLDRLFASLDGADVAVILCDSGSSAPTLRRIEALQRLHPALRVARLARNDGFTAAVNHGLTLARPGDHVVLLNNDAIVTPGWLQALAAVADLPECGIAVPAQLMLPGTAYAQQHAPLADPTDSFDVSLSVHHANVLPGPARPDGLVELAFAPFFCVLLTRAALAALGPLDARRGRHYRSDSLYCLALRQETALKLLYTPRARVYHLSSLATATLRDERPEEYEMMYARNAWPGLAEPWHGPGA